ncbi:helix-turn-helix transcriptional regulator [Methylomarinum sp. Ch1-1]|uniref:Helix-turn-helix transcriptional regulator n=1 Tax=Methylomarinum roseum TaxID=3067653 RepID=A0AAU7NWG9_9GAMM|nr:helix-turn-helix transcriptional regulator [Methylomarinum sp. Ch1-1]MDP4522659.1 helix-turn-helix transcriptional regulator [Methylomarinum sp. Ch1-1]
MIRCHLARMMGEHKMRIADVARETGLSRATVTLLYKETAQKVDLEALDKLCELFDCGIGDLLERATPTGNKHQAHDGSQ